MIRRCILITWLFGECGVVSVVGNVGYTFSETIARENIECIRKL